MKDSSIDDSGVDDLLSWLNQASPYFEQTNHSGAVTVYKIIKNEN